MALDINIKKVKRVSLITILIIVGLALAGILIWTNYTYSEGTRNGTVVKLSKKGVMFKTWEGQLNLGAYIPGGNNGAPTNIWEFSVPKSKQEALDAIDESIEKGKRVKLHYKEKMVTLPWRGDTKYMIYKVDILE